MNTFNLLLRLGRLRLRRVPDVLAVGLSEAPPDDGDSVAQASSEIEAECNHLLNEAKLFKNHSFIKAVTPNLKKYYKALVYLSQIPTNLHFLHPPAQSCSRIGQVHVLL